MSMDPDRIHSQARSRSASLRSLSTTFRSSLRSIQTRITGGCGPRSDPDSTESPSVGVATSSRSPSSLSSRVSSLKTQMSERLKQGNLNGSRTWKRLRNAIRIQTILKRSREKSPDPGSPEADSSAPLSPGDIPRVDKKHPDDWFYQCELKECDAAKQRRRQLSEDLAAVREQECTFRPSVTDLSRKPRSKSSFLRRQRKFEIQRSSLRHFQTAKQEWVLRDITKDGLRNKVADPQGVWERSVNWHNERLSRRISRQIDQRVQALSLCPFEPVRDWQRRRAMKAQDFRAWKNNVNRQHRIHVYRDLADVVMTISNETASSDSY